MPHSKNSEKQPESPVRQLADLKQLVQTYLQEYLEQEVACHLGALPYERDVGVFQGIAFDLAEVSLSQERSKIKILGDLVAADYPLEEKNASLGGRTPESGVWD